MTPVSLNLDCILVLIPVRNEEATIAAVIDALQQLGFDRIRMIDNGSSDRSGEVAEAAGAEVVAEPRSGYGQACWRGLQDLPDEMEWILFCDGDGSDDLSQLPEFLAVAKQADLILGDRLASLNGRAALTPAQNFGNRLATRLIRLGWGHGYGDLGPLRLIRRSALEQMQMRDRGFGWTVEMQVRAVELGLRIRELPVNYYPRQGGRSKISGTLSGSVQAGVVILQTIARLYGRRLVWQVRTASPLVWLSALLILVGAGWLAPNGDFRQVETFLQFGIGVGLLGAGFALSWAIGAIEGLWFWGVALLARLVLLRMYPGNDVWRYLWEGYIQTLGFSPYHFAPTAEALAPYQTTWWGMINHPTVSAIYPPLTQLGFHGLAAIAPSVLLFKLAFVAADLLVCWLLSRRFGYTQTLLYAWNPLVLYCFAGAAHYDSWFILPLVAAWLAIDPAPSTPVSPSPHSAIWLNAVLLGISTAVKWVSLPMLGVLGWRSRQQGARHVGLVMLLGCLPFILSALVFCRGGMCPLVPTESVFVSSGRSAELVPYLVNLVWQPAQQVNWIFLLPLGIVTVALGLRSNTFLHSAEGYFLALLMLSPIIHAWYFTWVIPFAVASRNLGTRWLSLSAFVYFVLPHREGLGDSNWLLTPAERGWLWLPLIIGWAWTASLQLFAHLRKPSAKTHLDRAQ